MTDMSWTYASRAALFLSWMLGAPCWERLSAPQSFSACPCGPLTAAGTPYARREA